MFVWLKHPFQSRLFRLLVSAFALEGGIVGAEGFRVGNATLAFPQQPPEYGFKVVDAFPGLYFSRPVALTAPPGETNRLFIVEQGGRIQVITNLANPTKTLFLDISSRITEYGESGLLGMAFHPGYATNREFYLFYTLTATSSEGSGLHDRLALFKVSPDNPNIALPESEVALITQFDQESNHNAGDLHFGPDGYLYVALGDEGGWGGEHGNSQRIDKDFFSGILRLDVDKRPGSLVPNPHPAIHTNANGVGYHVPPDNPYVGVSTFLGQALNPGSVRTEFWAVGLRNPWRMSFDQPTGLLYCADVGQGAREEVNVIQKGGNYGWVYREGTLPFCCTPPPGTVFTEPILDYARRGEPGDPSLQGECVIGGVVYRGSRMEQISGHYVFGDHGSASIWALRYDGTNTTAFRRLTGFSPFAFGLDPANGDVLMTGPGEVVRLTYDTQVTGAELPATLANTGAFSDLVNLSPEPGIEAYEINTAFWSDHGNKRRWFSVPDTNLTIGFSSTGNWSFPTGTVWIKHFELELTNGVPESARRLETRFLVRNPAGVYGVTYRWGNSITNADLVPQEGLDESFVINDGGSVRTQIWHYPSRTECLSCHTPVGGFALGFNTQQLNRPGEGSGPVTNQLLALSHAGYFNIQLAAVEALPALSPATNEASSVTHRVRSYLAANCAHCHQPGGSGQGFWDARFTTPLDQAGILDGPVANHQGNPGNRVIKAGSIANSMMLTRLANLGTGHMPPLATSVLNHEAISLLSRWVTNELVSLSVVFATNRLQYNAGAGPRILDGYAVLEMPELGSLASTRLTASLVSNGTAADQLGLLNAGSGAGQIGVAGNAITYAGVVVGSFTGGTNGFTPLTITFGTNATREAAQAVLRHVTYENPASTPSWLPRELQLTLEAFYGAASTPALMTIELVPTLEPAEFTNLTLTGDGTVQLAFTGHAARSYRLQYSLDLQEWHVLTNLHTGGDGSGTYSGAAGVTNAAACFYRIVWP